jgi:hypothetical protein
MVNSILQKLIELAKNINERAKSGEITDLDLMAASVLADCKAASSEIIELIIEEMNRGLREDKAFRREHGLVIKEKDRPRSLLTALGPIDFKRDYYYDKNTGKHRAILDPMLGIERYERIGGEVGAALVNQAADCSYAKAAQIVTGGAVSRQTVRTQLLKAHVPEAAPRVRGKGVPCLHVYADEDHVHMQKPNKERGKCNRVVPLVTVTEGTSPVSERRNKTINPMHFSDGDLDPKAVWKSVEGYIEQAYNVEAVEKIYVHGDGGNWISKGLECFAQTVHAMDGYHFYKALRGVSKILPKRNIRVALINALKHNDRDRADEYIQDLLNSPLSEKERKHIMSFATYLFGSWEDIMHRVVDDIPGSCTEAQISHVLSERLSRDPLGWSKEGLGQIVQARVYLENGGRLEKKDMRAPEEGTETYSQYADHFIEEYVKGACDFSIFEREEPILDGASATQILLGKIGRPRSLLA